MSANNELQIQKHNNHFRVASVDVDGGGGFFIDNVEYPTAKDALKAATEYEQNEIFEIIKITRF